MCFVITVRADLCNTCCYDFGTDFDNEPCIDECNDFGNDSGNDVGYYFGKILNDKCNDNSIIILVMIWYILGVMIVGNEFAVDVGDASL